MKIENNNFCTLYLVRHGETTWNVEHIVQGHHDAPLTEKGIEQAKETAGELKDIKFDAIFSSDLGRAKRSAEIIRLERNLAINTSRELRERTLGTWEGRSGDEYRENFKEIFDKLGEMSEAEQRSLKLADDIENDNQIIARFITKLREIAVAYPGKTVLVTTHGGPIRTFLMHLGYVKYGTQPANSFANAGYVKVLCDGIDFEITAVKGLSNPIN